MFNYLVIIALFVPLALTANSNNVSIVIVGAGAAGIAAASKLIENGFTNLKILEGENRIGGRIQTVQIGKNIIDLGAEYLHGERKNVIYEMVNGLDLIEQSPKGLSKKFYYSNGTKFDATFTAELESVLIHYYKRNWNISTTGLSTGVYFSKIFNSEIQRKYRNYPDKLRIWTDGFHFAEIVTNMAKSSFSWFEPSVDTHYEECEGHFYYHWKGKGFRTFLDLLIAKFPTLRDKIMLKKRVSKINWKENREVQVITSDNSLYSADHVIFTPSLGVLKYHRQLFQPELPRDKTISIDSLGYDGVLKIALEFPNQWWDDRDQHFCAFWRNEDVGNSLNFFPEGPNENGISWISRIAVFVVPRHTTNIMITWLTGPMVPELEKMELETMKKGFTFVLNKFIGGDYNITEPIRIVRSSWYTNDHFKGSNSYESVGNFSKDVSFQKTLSQPLVNEHGDPVLLFAGESTHPTHYGTTHGAVETGFREAYRIINLYK